MSKQQLGEEIQAEAIQNFKGSMDAGILKLLSNKESNIKM